jgi:hypothetical protein
MEYVKLGSAGLKVSRLCLGTMTYGSKKWREWVLEEAEARWQDPGSPHPLSEPPRCFTWIKRSKPLTSTSPDEMKALEEPYEAHPVLGH